MDRNRRTAVWIGVLYITGTVAGILSVGITNPLLSVPVSLGRIAAHQNAFVLGILLVLTMGLALAMIPVLMFPILRKEHEALALGYVVFRGALETVTYFALAITWFFLLVVSQQAAAAGATAVASLGTLGAVLPQLTPWLNQLVTIVFILGALMFYSLLYRSRLVPRWISLWGLIAAVPYLAAGLFVLFGLSHDNSTLDTLLRLPVAVQEMVLAVWLIVKGFQPAALVSLSARAGVN